MRVLISNYSAASQTVLKAVMIKLGHKVEVVGDGIAALASLQRPAGPKLAILDSKLPGLDGLEVCRRIKQEASSPRICVILMASANNRTEVLQVIDAGADDYLQKPIDATELTARMRIVERTINERQQLLDLLAANGTTPGKVSEGLGGATDEAKPPAGSADEEAKKRGKNQKLFTDKHASLNGLRAFTEFDSLLIKVFAEMGLGEATALDAEVVGDIADFSILSVIVVPEKSAWLDIVFEVDRRSAQALFTAMTGAEECTRDELVDMTGEVLNMVQGAIKGALQDGFLDVLTPVIPFRVSPEKRGAFSFVASECSQHAYSLPGMTLRLSLFAHVAPVVTKSLDDVRVRDVSVGAVNLPGSPKLILLNKGTMLNDHHLQRLREMTGCGFVKMKFEMIAPSGISARYLKI